MYFTYKQHLRVTLKKLINASCYCTIKGASVKSNLVTLPAGTYHVEGRTSKKNKEELIKIFYEDIYNINLLMQKEYKEFNRIGLISIVEKGLNRKLVLGEIQLIEIFLKNPDKLMYDNPRTETAIIDIIKLFQIDMNNLS